MARNLCTSQCCNTIVRLSDLRDKPIEFRRYPGDVVHIGTRWVCPECGTVYFAFWRDRSEYSIMGVWTPKFVIDLSYYESFNDEHGDDPAERRHMCLNDATDIQWVW